MAWNGSKLNYHITYYDIGVYQIGDYAFRRFLRWLYNFLYESSFISKNNFINSLYQELETLPC